MNNHTWMIKNIESEPLAVSAKVVKPDLVLIEGNLRQVISYVDDQGIVKRQEGTIPFSRQTAILGALPGHSVKVDIQVHSSKPRQGVRVYDTTLLTMYVTVEDNQGIVGYLSEDFLLHEPREVEQPSEPMTAKVQSEKLDTAENLKILQEQLETEYALRYEQDRFEFEKQLRTSYQDDLRMHVEQLRAEMQSELNRRWRQQLSSYQHRTGYRGSVEFGRG